MDHVQYAERKHTRITRPAVRYIARWGLAAFCFRYRAASSSCPCILLYLLR